MSACKADAGPPMISACCLYYYYYLEEEGTEDASGYASEAVRGQTLCVC